LVVYGRRQYGRLPLATAGLLSISTCKEVGWPVAALRTYPELRENAVVERHVSDATAIAMCQCLGRAVTSSHTDSLGQNLLQLRRRAASDQRPYQSQSVVVEVRLQRNTPHLTSHTHVVNHFTLARAFVLNVYSRGTNHLTQVTPWLGMSTQMISLLRLKDSTTTTSYFCRIFDLVQTCMFKAACVSLFISTVLKFNIQLYSLSYPQISAIII